MHTRCQTASPLKDTFLFHHMLLHHPHMSLDACLVNHFHLTTQHHCDDPILQEILNHLRYCPSQKLLNDMHENRVICRTNQPSEQDIAKTLVERPNSTILTVTRSASNRVNAIAVRTLFLNEIPICIVQCDSDLPPIPLYRDMSVIITQNRDKRNGAVNGRRAHVYMVQNNIVLLKLSNGAIINTYLVMARKSDGTKKITYPFLPGYALTICKSQGQTLPGMVIWMDSMFVPAGAAYVACHELRNLTFLTEMFPNQYTPVNLE